MTTILSTMNWPSAIAIVGLSFSIAFLLVMYIDYLSDVLKYKNNKIIEKSAVNDIKEAEKLLYSTVLNTQIEDWLNTSYKSEKYRDALNQIVKLNWELESSAIARKALEEKS